MALGTASCFHHSTLLHFSCIWLKLQLEWANREIRHVIVYQWAEAAKGVGKRLYEFSHSKAAAHSSTQTALQSMCMQGLQFVCDSCHGQLHLFSCLPGPEKWQKHLLYSLVRWSILTGTVVRTQLTVSLSQNLRPIFGKTSTTHSLFANFVSFCIYYKQRGLKRLSLEPSVCIKIFPGPSPPTTFSARGNFIFSHRHYKYDRNIFFFLSPPLSGTPS